eukprot:CAMPEP_0177611796 /NCGR_PEP_ID=MMETSP0419_2-20121207/20756_1 /TAXON_ID=582737 /ORGANISM="Tetraselmis sp., Strain GSL018" /LENGTH=45 /DNA_ID= /DNA_START= /DNA_END= /DNA_ORIENTATION=
METNAFKIETRYFCSDNCNSGYNQFGQQPRLSEAKKAYRNKKEQA